SLRGWEVVLLRADQRGRDGFLCNICNIGASAMVAGGGIIELPGDIDCCGAVTGLGAVIPSIPGWPSEGSSPHATSRLELMIRTSSRVLMRNPPSLVTSFAEREKFTL